MEVKDCFIWAQEDGIVIEGSLLKDKKNSSAQWALRDLGGEHFIMHTTDEKSQASTGDEMLAYYSIDIFADFLLVLFEKKWNGSIIVSLNDCEKKMYLRNGEIVFAASSLVDDRLGEVVFREGILSIDAWVEAAAKVNRGTKFGQTLLESRILNKQQLWDMLKLQVLEIIRSIFMAEMVFVRIREDVKPPTMICFDTDTRYLVEESLCFGVVYRDFISRLAADTEIVTMTSVSGDESSSSNDFFSDLLKLVDEHKIFTEIVKSSKLSSPYTAVMLLRLIQEGLCAANLRAPTTQATSSNLEIFAIDNQIATYNQVVDNAHNVCNREGIALPVDDLKKFVLSSDAKNFKSLRLDDSGRIADESHHSIAIQVQCRGSRGQHFLKKIDALTMFLLQVIGDTISFAAVKEIRGDFK